MTRPLSWKWEHQSASWWFATFKVGDLSYKVDFDIHSNTEAVVRFSSEAGIGVTGAGNAFAVFATVSKILFAFLEEARPIRFFFSAEFDENSRIKLSTPLASV